MFLSLKRTPTVYPLEWPGRTFIAGDIHYQIKELYTRLSELNFDPDEDRLFLVGDLMDRGPDAMDLLDLLRKSCVHSVMGNHEYNYILRHDGLRAASPGKDEWLQKLTADEREELYLRIRAMPALIELVSRDGMTKYGICHYPNFSDWDAFKLELREDFRKAAYHCMFSRDRYTKKVTDPIRNIDRVYAGHVAVDKVTTLGNVIHLDTGAGKKGRVTVIEL